MLRSHRFILASLAVLTALSLAAALAVFSGGRDGGGEEGTGTLSLGAGPQAVRLTVTATGIAALAESEVRQAGLPVDRFAADGLSLSRDGQPVPFFAREEMGENVLYFYAQAITGTSEAAAVYWLAPGEGAAMAEQGLEAIDSGDTPARITRQQRWEDNLVFLAQATGDDLWLGPLLFAPGSVEVELDGLTPTGGAAQLTTRIWSNNEAPPDPDHHVQVWLNETLLTDAWWDGIGQHTVVVAVPGGLLRPDGNVLTLTAPGDTGAAGEQLYLDWVELIYESDLDISAGQVRFQAGPGRVSVDGLGPAGILLDVTDPDRPVRLLVADDGATVAVAEARNEGQTFQFAAPESALRPSLSVAPAWNALRGAGRGADYVAIVADGPGMAEATQPLLDYRAAQGHSVALVQAAQIFDEFGYGRQSPEAMRDFLTYAAASWEPSPQFVLLVGDASYDVNNRTGGRNQNWLPTYLVSTHFAGYVASDTWFALRNDSLAPDLAIGRFPAQTAEQVATMVAKTIAYEASAGSDWIGRALLVADDEDAFDVASDRLALQLGDVGYRPQRLYMTENDDSEYNRNAIFGALSQGVGIINYVGHGSIDVWGDEKVLSAADAALLSNRDRLPIFTTFTCLNGYFNHPQVDALAETLLWSPVGGVVAAVAPSGRTTTNQQTPLADAFYEALLTGRAGTLGEALAMAKASAADRPSLRDVIHTFNLLGDPALRFQRPPDR